MSKQKFVKAPLPFRGQKQMFLAAFRQALDNFSPTATYVDLFGGSGLLSYTTKQHYPNARVIYNDYDNYTERLKHIAKTNVLLADIKAILGNKKYAGCERVEEGKRRKILQRIEAERGFVDYITLSANLCFSMYIDNWDEFKKQPLYPRDLVRSIAPTYVKQYNTDINSYLQGLEVVCSEAYVLYKGYINHKDVVFILDPPYLNTDQSSYKNKGWDLLDYLDIVQYLRVGRYIYFTSNKSKIIELFSWMEKETDFKNPFQGAYMVQRRMRPNHKSNYMDIMIFKS